MINGYFHPWRLTICLMLIALSACNPQGEGKKDTTAHVPSGEVRLSPDSPKRGYITEAVVELSRRPLMEPVTGKLGYDETRTARISSPISGRVVGKIAALGDKVEVGDVLAELDSPELGQAQSDYANALADVSLAERAYQRVKNLYDQGVTPRKDFEQAQDVLTRARSEADRARLKLANLGVRDDRRDDRFALHSPIAGIITERNINPGFEVRPDLPNSLFVVSDLSRLWLLMDVFEKDIGLIHVGEQVSLSVPAFPGERFSAGIEYISQVVDETSRTVKVRCVLPNTDGKLLPAMYASVEVQSDPNDQSIVVPLNALFTEGESDWLFIAKGDGHYQKRSVKVGLRLKDKAVIQDGVKPGERLVVDGALLLRTEEDADRGDERGNP